MSSQAGGGNQQIGASIVRKEPVPTPDMDVYDIGGGAYVVDKRQQIARVLEGMKLEITNEMPQRNLPTYLETGAQNGP